MQTCEDLQIAAAQLKLPEARQIFVYILMFAGHYEPDSNY